MVNKSTRIFVGYGFLDKLNILARHSLEFFRIFKISHALYVNSKLSYTVLIDNTKDNRDFLIYLLNSEFNDSHLRL